MSDPTLLRANGIKAELDKIYGQYTQEALDSGDLFLDPSAWDAAQTAKVLAKKLFNLTGERYTPPPPSPKSVSKGPTGPSWIEVTLARVRLSFFGSSVPKGRDTIN